MRELTFYTHLLDTLGEIRSNAGRAFGGVANVREDKDV